MIWLPATARVHAASPEDTLAGEILHCTGVTGGVVVHVGCGDGKLTAALCAGEPYLVHGLDSDSRHVAAARQTVQDMGRYGPTSIHQLSGQRLPYVDNMVNLLVVSGPLPVAEKEVLRVLCPGGTALFLKADGGPSAAERVVKPWPGEIDDWTHYLHNATGNAVANDTTVGPPRHLQWVGSPTWTRHHDHMSSFNAMVSSGGRVFYIMDEGPRSEIQLPPEWKLTARDAFNGTLLWQRSIDDWHTHLWPLKSGPAQLPRRLVAVGDRVFITLGLDAPLAVLDAATGETIRVFQQTRAAEEVLYCDGVLLCLVHENPTSRPWSTLPSYAGYDQLRTEPETWAWKEDSRSIVAIAEDSGELLWKKTSVVAPLTLATDATGVFYHDGTKVVCLDRSKGQQKWASQPIAEASDMRSWFAPTLVVKDGVVVFAGGENIVRHRGGIDTMTALSAETGAVLWTAEHPPSGYDSPEDVLIVDGLVWTAPITNRRDTGFFTGRDLHTGEMKRSFPADDGDHMPHHRCHRAKATERFILASRTGIEYVDLQAEHWNRNDWVRGACLYGIMPANGLTYAPPQSCACYIVSKLNGLNALAPARTAEGEVEESEGQEVEGVKREDGARLVRGPAFDAMDRTLFGTDGPWPTYRCDAARTGWSKTRVASELRLGWKRQIGGRLSSPVVAEGKVFVAAVDKHAVHALDEHSGQLLWTFTAGARVDSPPSVWQGRVLFGCRDGCVYCLTAFDGSLVWRFRAAATDQQLVAFEQIESVWPVHGSVLVRDGIVHCVAGRSMFLDGGMRYVRLDAATGRLLSETVLDDRHPETGQALDAEIRWPNLPVALPDILSSDGQSVYMRSQRFDLSGRRTDVVAATDFTDQTGEGAHLFAITGFLDDSWWHRTFWMYGKTALGGAGGWYLPAYRAPTGRIMICDDSRVYAFDRQPQYYPQTTSLEYHLYAAKKEPEIIGGRSPASSSTPKNRRPTPSHPQYDWSYQTPMLGRAMVLADQTIFVAGPPDLVEQEQTIARLDDPATEKSLAEQAAAMRGERGSLLLAVSATEGKQLAAYRLPSVPVFDGMAAAGGCLFISTVGGRVLCLGPEGQPLEAAPDAQLTDRPEPSGNAAAVLTASHPDFQQLTDIRVSHSDLGYRLQTPSGKVGFAVKQLDAPLTGRTAFRLRLRMIPRDKSERSPGNGFLVFGDAADDQNLIKCGLRNAGQQGLIVQGPLMQGKIAQRPIVSKTNEVIEIEVAVDLEQQTVAMQLLGETVRTELTRPLRSITHIGYAIHSVTTQFGSIEVDH